MPNSVQAEPAETTAPIMQDIPGRDRTISVPVDTLLELKKGLSALNERVTDLESENFTIQKQLEALLQAEERRKYLGTDSSLVPYGIDVQRSSGAATRVQVNSSLRIGDLIRRIRTKCDVSPSESKNPRVEFHGQQVGHGMTLSEAGITADAVVHFSHSE